MAVLRVLHECIFQRNRPVQMPQQQGTQAPTSSVVVRVVITVSNGDNADTDRERGGNGGDRHQQWR